MTTTSYIIGSGRKSITHRRGDGEGEGFSHELVALPLA